MHPEAMVTPPPMNPMMAMHPMMAVWQQALFPPVSPENFASQMVSQQAANYANLLAAMMGGASGSSVPPGFVLNEAAAKRASAKPKSVPKAKSAAKGKAKAKSKAKAKAKGKAKAAAKKTAKKK